MAINFGLGIVSLLFVFILYFITDLQFSNEEGGSYFRMYALNIVIIGGVIGVFLLQLPISIFTTFLLGFAFTVFTALASRVLVITIQ